MIARSTSPLACGADSSAQVANAPDDSPNTVTLPWSTSRVGS